MEAAAVISTQAYRALETFEQQAPVQAPASDAVRPQPAQQAAKQQQDRPAQDKTPGPEDRWAQMIAQQRFLEFHRTESGHLTINVRDGHGRLLRAIPPENFSEFMREQVGPGVLVNAWV